MSLRIGMLWLDDTSGRSLADKLVLASRHYEQKYGKRPNICYVSLHALEREKVSSDGLRLQAAHDVLPHHFWLGVAE